MEIEKAWINPLLRTWLPLVDELMCCIGARARRTARSMEYGARVEQHCYRTHILYLYFHADGDLSNNVNGKCWLVRNRRSVNASLCLEPGDVHHWRGHGGACPRLQRAAKWLSSSAAISMSPSISMSTSISLPLSHAHVHVL